MQSRKHAFIFKVSISFSFWKKKWHLTSLLYQSIINFNRLCNYYNKYKDNIIDDRLREDIYFSNFNFISSKDILTIIIGSRPLKIQSLWNTFPKNIFKSILKIVTVNRWKTRIENRKENKSMERATSQYNINQQIEIETSRILIYHLHL